MHACMCEGVTAEQVYMAKPGSVETVEVENTFASPALYAER